MPGAGSSGRCKLWTRRGRQGEAVEQEKTTAAPMLISKSLAAPSLAGLRKVFTSSDGMQQLTYAEFGHPNSTNVVYYQHGWPGSRLGGSMLHEAGLKNNTRIIAVDRPGFGASPFTPQHSLASWAAAMEQLSDHLGIQQFSILGASGGAPFAAACAHYISSGRVTSLGLLCPLGPIHTVTKQGMAAMNSAFLAAAKYWPGLARGIWKLSRQVMHWDEDCLRRLAFNAQDKAAMKAAPHVARAIRLAVLEGLRSGAHGVVHEMALIQRCWGFSLKDVQVQYAFVWHGLQDPLVPYQMARQYELIPGCQAAYFPHETHTTIVINRLAAALEALVKQDWQQASRSLQQTEVFGEHKVLPCGKGLLNQQMLQQGNGLLEVSMPTAVPHAVEKTPELLLHGPLSQQTGLSCCYKSGSTSCMAGFS